MKPTQLDGSLSIFTLKDDCEEVFVRHWVPPCGIKPRVSVIIIHGIAEHSGRYDRLARYLAAKGAVVYALDLPGHGRTAAPGELGDAGPLAWERMTAAVTSLACYVNRRHVCLPMVSIGHSMGSALNQWLIQNHGALLQGSVLCGTFGRLPGDLAGGQLDTLITLMATTDVATRKTPSEIMAAALGRFASAFVKDGDTPTGTEWLTRDAAEARTFLRDPLCAFVFTNETTLSVLRGFLSLWADTSESRIPKDLPLLLIAGEDDPVGEKAESVRALIARYMQSGLRDLCYRFYPGSRHELLNELERADVHRLLSNWMERVLD